VTPDGKAVGNPGRITWIGHATTQIEVGGANLITDPVLRDRVAHLRRSASSPEPLAPHDAVLISHAHRDHLDLPSLRELAPGSRAIAPRGYGRLLERAGFMKVDEVEPGDRVEVAGVEIMVTEARHHGGRHPLGAPPGAVGYLVAGPQRVYFAGDTDVFDEMKELAGDLDVALLPVWGWGRRVGPGHMDPPKAARAAALLAPRVAVPIHWGTLASPGATRARSDAPALEFEQEVARLAPDVRVRVLAPGKSLELGAE
jgi:L-ascorbate metabolism protein UlaG (beta-lactamase superfamily)